MSTGDDPGSTAAFAQDHLTTLLRFLPRRDEAARAAAYDLGRRAFTSGISLIEVCRTHEDAVLAVMRDCPGPEQLAVASAGADLLLDLVAAYDMTHPGPDAATPSP
ncbi:phosphoserine phosphatase RsbU-like protein [Humibacillus xanthopallidus]|uniref:Phosphoserine phosphatase RsbU-like protein n=1 Tax=Humibacillus xanthopallidus TaxID=412689 RepID=A0A543PT77_9MICO|nr:phosphatase RsbU N-terminal domain-containing protein [Humibacillus xanthopallidus]TQN47256.1 phosphoserine phosphatase RsbU-like protein [Humibacillus xanthopallidus]